MRVPAGTLTAIGSRLVLLWHDGDLATVEELEHEEEDFVADGVNRDDSAGPRRVDSRSAGGVEVAGRRRWVGAAEEFPEEEAPGGEDASVGVD